MLSYLCHDYYFYCDLCSALCVVLCLSPLVFNIQLMIQQNTSIVYSVRASIQCLDGTRLDSRPSQTKDFKLVVESLLSRLMLDI